MALTNGANLGLLINGTAGEAHYAELMAQWRGMDLLVMPVVIDRDLSSPPGSPANGDSYIVGASPSGAWVSQTYKLARWSGSAWEFYAPKEGWQVYVADEDTYLTYTGSAWIEQLAPLLLVPNNQAGTSYTYVLLDQKRVTRFTAATAVGATVPTNAAVPFPIGAVLNSRQVGAGEVTFTAAGGVTFNIPTGFQAKTARQGSTIAFHKVGSDEWDVLGDLKAA